MGMCWRKGGDIEDEWHQTYTNIVARLGAHLDTQPQPENPGSSTDEVTPQATDTRTENPLPSFKASETNDRPVPKISSAKSGRRLTKKPYAHLMEWELVFATELIEIPPALQANGSETVSIRRKKLTKPAKQKRRIASKTTQLLRSPQPPQSLDIPITAKPLSIATTPNTTPYEQTSREPTQHTQLTTALTDNFNAYGVTTNIPPHTPNQPLLTAPGATLSYTPTSTRYGQPRYKRPVQTSYSSYSRYSSNNSSSYSYRNSPNYQSNACKGVREVSKYSFADGSSGGGDGRFG